MLCSSILLLSSLIIFTVTTLNCFLSSSPPHLFFLGFYLVHSKVKVKVKSLSQVRLFVTLWTVALQAPPSMGFSRQEYWSGLPSPSPGDLPDPGIEPRSPTLQADALPSEPPGKTVYIYIYTLLIHFVVQQKLTQQCKETILQ